MPSAPSSVVRPATRREFRVTWYEAPKKTPIRVQNPDGTASLRMPSRQKAARKEVFFVMARTIVEAKKAAGEYVKKRGGKTPSVHVAAKSDTLVAYTRS